MNCRECQSQFEAIFSGQSADAVRVAVNAHLASCDECARAHAREQKLWAILGNARTVRPSHGFAERTLRRIDEAPERESVAWRILPRWAMAGAAVLVATAIGGSLLWHEHRERKQVEHFAELFNAVASADFEVLSEPLYENGDML